MCICVYAISLCLSVYCMYCDTVCALLLYVMCFMMFVGVLCCFLVLL